jgi:hypothetical protein
MAVGKCQRDYPDVSVPTQCSAQECDCELLHCAAGGGAGETGGGFVSLLI